MSFIGGGLEMSDVAIKIKSLGAYYSQTAAAFHRVSGFGRFPEPEPPYTFPEVQTDDASGALSQSLDSIVSDVGGASVVSPLLLEVIDARLSERSFGSIALPEAYIGSLLWAAYGKRTKGGEVCNRVVPSAGATYPLSVYLLALFVEGVSCGFHRYQPDSNSLVFLPQIIIPSRVNDWFRTTHIDYTKAAAIVFIVGNWQGICPKYGARGYRYLLLEAGHMAQNVCLLATALGVSHVPVGGFVDDAVNTAFDLDTEKEGTVYSVVLGQLSQQRAQK